MQEKVSHAPPPEIRITEGKPPPSSWVNDNIVQYLQTESEASFLKDVLSYAQSLQSQQLTQARPQTAEIRPSFVPIPEKGSAEDIANAALFNDTQGLVKTEMENLQKLITILLQGNPKLASALKPLTDELNQLRQSFPHLTPQQMQNLNTIWQNITTMAQALPMKYQQSFYNTQIDMLQSMMAENKGNIQDLQSEIKELQARIQLLTQINQLMTSIQNSLSQKPLTREKVQELIENLQNLANSYGKLDPQQQQALSALFEQLNQFKTAQGKPLSQLLADALLQTKLAAFLKSNPQATPTQVASYMRQFLKESNLQNSPLSFMKSLGDTIEDKIGQEGFPKNINEQELNALLAAYSPDPQSSASLKKAAEKMQQSAQEEISADQNKIQGFTNDQQELQKLQDTFGRAAANAVVQSMGAGSPPPSKGAQAAAGAAPPKGDAGGGSSGSLPNQFRKAILNHYMPGQEAYLEALAMMLSIDNMGASMGNILLQQISDFPNAGINYGFSGGLRTSNSPPNFSGSYSKAKQQLSNEKNQCNNDINHVNDALKSVQSQINKINEQLNSKPPPTPSQAKALNEMKSKLQGIQTNLTAALGQLNTLKTLLSQISIQLPTGNPPPAQSQYFTVSGPAGWQSSLSSDENAVVNGVTPPGGGPTQGGLINLNSQITTFQQDYSNQSQNQQMILQMRMTEIQQEWTVVSTALQLLNQMYMSLSQAIYK